MTHEEIVVLKPGRELDALVAEKVMRLRCVHWSDCELWYEDEHGTFLSVPNYSTDISAAWEVVEKFNDIVVRRYETIGGDFRYVCSIATETGKALESAPTAPHAICLVALMAVME